MSADPSSARLPMQGLVLAGGRSSRMGRDKATLIFRGQPMVVRALETLQAVCDTVAIAGNRDDLAHYAPVVREEVPDAGPLGGMVAGLGAAGRAWSMFLPVDVPLLPAGLLRRWGAAVLLRAAGGTRLSYLRANGRAQPTVALLHKECLSALATALAAGERRLESAFAAASADFGENALWTPAAREFLLEDQDEASLFSNLNCPEDLLAAEDLATEAIGRGKETHG